LPTHMLYVDDSGTKEYAASPDRYGAGNTRHFVFGGVLIQQPDIHPVRETIRAAKEACFGSADVEIKSNWLRLPGERQRRYLEPFGLRDEQLDAFVESYYRAVGDAPLTFVVAIVDKVHMQEDYPWNPWYPPSVAYEILLQRAENELRGANRTFAVVVDDMTGATPRGNQYKVNLARHHDRLKQSGSRLRNGFTFTTLEGRVKFVPSQSEELIQVADLAAYNVLRQFRDHGEEWENYQNRPLPTYRWFERLGPKFRKKPGGTRIQGYGVVKFPLRHRVPWAIVDDDAQENEEAAP
jgi:hypothetical protein